MSFMLAIGALSARSERNARLSTSTDQFSRSILKGNSFFCPVVTPSKPLARPPLKVAFPWEKRGVISCQAGEGFRKEGGNGEGTKKRKQDAQKVTSQRTARKKLNKQKSSPKESDHFWITMPFWAGHPPLGLIKKPLFLKPATLVKKPVVLVKRKNGFSKTFVSSFSTVFCSGDGFSKTSGCAESQF